MGAVQTRDLFQPTYGYMETMVKIPDVAGSNPAIWTMPKRTDDGSDWSWGEPAFPGDNDYKFGAEIDILERPHPDGNSSYADLVDKYHLTIHYDNYAFDKHTKFHKEPTLNAPYKWHKFSMEWTPEYINFYVDGKLVETQDKDVPNQEEILILSYGLGGWIGTVAPDMVYSEMMVDYVRWYQVDPVTAKMNTNFLTVNIEETKTLTIEIVEDGKTVDVTDPVISWVSSNPSIASVDNNGNITGLLEGTATITATTQSGRTDTCDVSVSEVGKVKPGYKLVFEDNFSGDKLDNTKWNNWCVDLTKPEPFRYANSKEVALVPENAYVKDGSLRLLGSKEETIFENEEPSQYRMGAVHTKDIFEPTYGYMETMVRIPNVPGSNPAIWTMPRASEKGGWQWDSDNGSGKFGAEIDILERPHPEGDSQYAGLNDKYWITMHYDNYEFTNHTKYHVQPAINNPYEWHKFGMEWTPEYINFILDGKIMATQNKDVPNSPEIFILSYGLGGWIGKIADQKLPAEMIVDYVRWYQIDKTSVQVVPNKLDLKAGESKQLKVQFTPQNTTDKVEQWISSKDSIASVDENGKVTAQSNGSVKIRLITVEGRIATCDVTVTGYSDGDGSTPVPFPTQPINTGNPTDPSVIDTPQISTSTEATENGGSLEKTTTITTDSNGNIQMETVIIEKDKNGTVLGKTIQISKEDKRAGTTVTVEAKQDAQGKVLEPKVSVTETKALIEVNGSKSSVNVVLNVDFINQMIKDSKVPVQLSISVAPSTVFDQLRDRNIKDIVLNITVPNALDLNYKTKIQTITLEKEVIHLAKSGGKNISAIIRDEKGKENYSWTFKSSILKNSKCKIDDVNLALAVTTIKSLTEDKVMKDQVSKISPNGIAIAFSHTGLLPSTAKVKVYVGDKKGFTEGKKVYLYYYNKSVNKLDKLAKEEYKIEKGGYITLNITHCSNYVILPVRANNARGLLSQVYVPTKQMIKKGKSSLKIVNPSTLKIVSRYSKNNDPGVTEALVTYKSSKTSVASISSNGKITAKKIGTTKIKVNMELQDGTKKSIVVNVKVK